MGKDSASQPLSAVIYGLAGSELTVEERAFFKHVNPYGYIFFARNCESPAQVKALTASLRELSGREDVPVLIDQEGGRVARLKPPHWRAAPPCGLFAALAEKDLAKAKQASYLNARLIARELHDLGINVDCAPMVDVRAPGSHDIIGDRAFGTEPEQVSILAREMARGLMEGGVAPVIKHIPGHGRAKVDSHESLPQVDESLETLRRSDFTPFHALRDLPIAMTAHILYTAIDAGQVATLSPTVIRLIREEIGFGGLLLSDDLSMKALSGGLGELTRQTLAAGCDIVLHCNGKMEEMQAIAEVIAPMTKDAVVRAKKVSDCFILPKKLDYAAAEKELSSLLA